MKMSTCAHLPVQDGSFIPPLHHGGHGAPPLQNRLDHCNREDGRFRGAHLTRGGQCYSLSSCYAASFSSPSHPRTHRLLFDKHHALLPLSKVMYCQVCDSGPSRDFCKRKHKWIIHLVSSGCIVRAMLAWDISVTSDMIGPPARPPAEQEAVSLDGWRQRGDNCNVCLFYVILSWIQTCPCS